MLSEEEKRRIEEEERHRVKVRHELENESPLRPALGCFNIFAILFVGVLALGFLLVLASIFQR